MKKKNVVGSGLTPDWLRKRNRIMKAIDEQLIIGLERSGAGLVLDQLQLVAEHRDPFEKKSGRKWKTWGTIKLGTGLKSASDFRKALKVGGYRISDQTKDFLHGLAFTESKTEEELELVVVSVAELGFKNRATLKDIYQRAKELGLDLCPAEVGPQLRLQYEDQPYGEWLRIAMEPFTDSVGYFLVFLVVHDEGGRWLYGDVGYPGGFWRGDARWVFVRCK